MSAAEDRKNKENKYGDRGGGGRLTDALLAVAVVSLIGAAGAFAAFVWPGFAKIPARPATGADTEQFTFGKKEKPYPKPGPESVGAPVGQVASPLEGKDFDDKLVKSSDYKGKVIVLDFWGNWSGYCRRIYAWKRTLVRNNKDRPFVLIGVNYEKDGDKEKAKGRIRVQQFDWPNCWDPTGRGSGGLAARYGVAGYPTFVVLDHRGVVRWRGHPFETARQQELEALLQTLYAERDGKAPKEAP
jgi:thiol-disulfide isomerase/thioredoxin